MGDFSWLRADNMTTYGNIYSGGSFKFLIPEEFGGGHIKDFYWGYGKLHHINEEVNLKYDMYELLAFWNYDAPYKDGTVKNYLEYHGKFPLMKEIDKYTIYNRLIGIEIGCYNDQIDQLKYPLKLVSSRYKKTYEECKGYSYGDPFLGKPTKREKYLNAPIMEVGDGYERLQALWVNLNEN